jgi:hypothetical protein
MERKISLPRGIRNNNPMNIVDTNICWKGESDTNDDAKFEEFDDMVYGIRAGVIILRGYNTKHGLKTIAEFINRFAPPHENDTKEYFEFVATRLGFDVDHEVDINNKDELFKLTKAIIIFENGMCPIEDGVIRRGVTMAMGAK